MPRATRPICTQISDLSLSHAGSLATNIYLSRTFCLALHLRITFPNIFHPTKIRHNLSTSTPTLQPTTKPQAKTYHTHRHPPKMSTFSYKTAKTILNEAEKERIICTYLNTTDPNANVRILSLPPLPTTPQSLTARAGRLGQSRRRVWL